MTTTNTIKLVGINAIPITVESKISNGIGIHIVGLADEAVKESLLRTVTALMATGYHITGKKVIINLAPADLNKNGSGYDLPIAISLLAEQGDLQVSDLDQWLILGELGLDGSIRSVPGSLQAAMTAIENGYKCIIPFADAEEVSAFVGDASVYAPATLAEAVKVIMDQSSLPTIAEMEFKEHKANNNSVWDSIIGHEGAKRALEIAAAGGHHVFIMGVPGSGKASLAKALTEILPPMTKEEALVNAAIYSASGRGYNAYYGAYRRPYRSPHASCSIAALLGGGSSTQIFPGEVSLANNGVLILDEFCEIPKAKLEALRIPMEDKKVVISRLKGKVEFPADFQLVASGNPCPCGYYGEGDRCTCTPGQRAAYLSRISGPVFDSIAIEVWVHPVPDTVIERNAVTYDSAATVAKRVVAAREIQKKRFENESFKVNDQMTAKDLERYAKLDEDCKDLMEKLINRLGLSARSYSRILKVARTIADLDGSDNIRTQHLAEAACYRFLDRMSNQIKTGEIWTR